MGRVRYEVDGPVATITMDDGKVNALSNEMFDELHGALDRARADETTVVLAGRDGVFSGGFDLNTLRGGGSEAATMVRAGFAFAERLLSFPTPVVIACTGHAIAMGVFVLLSGDYRVGADGPFRIVANEVAIGITMPRAAIEICRQRLNPAAVSRTILLAETFSPADGVGAGFLDRLTAPESVVASAQETAVALTNLNLAAHETSKRRMRASFLQALRIAIEEDDTELRAMLTS